uniref:C2H2-type domain-containing protein n=1 Tax=Tetraodon nigroviridis TaxID=99883 RepID=H3CWT6_TETNG
EVYVDLEQPPREEISCRFCGRGFMRDSLLKQHVSESHKGQKAFKCLKCNKEFEDRHRLILHVRIHTGERPFSCDFCGKTFIQNSSRIIHMSVHTGEKPYLCQKCGNRFATRKNLNTQVTLEGNTEEEIKCLECEKEFRKKADLRLHMRVHMDRKPFLCHFCGQIFSRDCDLIRHMDEIHMGERAFKCSSCDKEFARRNHLAIHLRIHTGERPHTCPFCKKSFAQRSNLNVHLRTHTGEKPYFCKTCEKLIAFCWSLRRHMRLSGPTKRKY